jgi:hypothetical protein
VTSTERAPADLLQQVVTAADQAEAELARLQADRQRQTGEWLATGQQGERPMVGHDEVQAERVANTARADADAARRARSSYCRYHSTDPSA